MPKKPSNKLVRSKSPALKSNNTSSLIKPTINPSIMEKRKKKDLFFEYNTKVARNKLNYEKARAQLNFYKRNSDPFIKNLQIDAITHSIPITKDVLKGDAVSATNKYLKSLKAYTDYLKDSKVSESSKSIYLSIFKEDLIKNMVTIIKKNTPKHLVLKQVRLPAEVVKRAVSYEGMLAQELYALKITTNPSRLGAKYAEYTPIDYINTAFKNHENPLNAFKAASEYNKIYKEGARTAKLDASMESDLRIKYGPDGKQIKTILISFNSHNKYSDLSVIYELIRAFLAREGHFHTNNKVVAEFLATAFGRKYTGLLINHDLLLNSSYQKYTGYRLYVEYIQKHGLNLSNLSKFMQSNAKYINSFDSFFGKSPFLKK